MAELLRKQNNFVVKIEKKTLIKTVIFPQKVKTNAIPSVICLIYVLTTNLKILTNLK